MNSDNAHTRSSKKTFWDFTKFAYQSSASSVNCSAADFELLNSTLTTEKIVQPVVGSEIKVSPHAPVPLTPRYSHCEPFPKIMNWQLDRPTIIQGKISRSFKPYLGQMLASGAKVVAAVCPGAAKISSSIPQFDLVADVVDTLGKISTSVICVSAEQVLDAGLEAIASGVEQLVIITPDVLPLDMIRLLRVARTNRVLVLGSGSAGLICPRGLSLGVLRPDYFRPGTVGVIGYDRALIYETAWVLDRSQMGQSWTVSLGKDRITGSNVEQWLALLQRDRLTEAIVLIQSAQDIDSAALEFVARSVTKPVVCYLAGSQAPLDRVYRKGIDILSNHLSQSIPASNCGKTAIANIQQLGLSLATQPSQIPHLIQQHSQILVS